jgi:WD40 repeat protein
MSEGRAIFTENLNQGEKSCLVYSAQFSKFDNGRYFAVSGIGSYQFHLYRTDERRNLASVNEVPKAVYSLDFAHSVEKVAFGAGDGVIRVFRYGENVSQDE